MKKEKFRLFLISVAVILLLSTVILYAFIASSKNKIGFGGLIPILIPLIVTAFMIFFIVRRYRDLKNGLPLEDERSRKVIANAAAKSFYVSLYWLLLISWFEPFFAKIMFGGQKLDASQTTGGAIAGMAIFFFVFWVYYDRKGKLL